MFRTLVEVMRNIQIVSKPFPPLGRWSPSCNKETAIKTIFANHDCCGDNLCGNPMNIKQQVEKEIYCNSNNGNTNQKINDVGDVGNNKTNEVRVDTNSPLYLI